MRCQIRVTLILFLYLSLVVISAHGSYIEQYSVSPLLKNGKYAEYEVLYHPTVNRFRITVVSVLSKTLILINVTLTLFTHENYSTLSLITVKGLNDTNTVVPIEIRNPDNSTHHYFLLASSSISIPKYQFYVYFPIISPNLSPSDYLNLDERKIRGVTVGYAAGEVFNLVLRQVMITSMENSDVKRFWEWDKDTGFILRYTNTISLPSQFNLVKTNLFEPPTTKVYKPTSLEAYVLDIYYLLGYVAGIYYSYWQAWAISGAIILLYFLQGWLRRYFEMRHRLKMYPELNKLLNKVESQEKKVMFIEVEEE